VAFYCTWLAEGGPLAELVVVGSPMQALDTQARHPGSNSAFDAARVGPIDLDVDSHLDLNCTRLYMRGLLRLRVF
jgi:hypothetical protein